VLSYDTVSVRLSISRIAVCLCQAAASESPSGLSAGAGSAVSPVAAAVSATLVASLVVWCACEDLSCELLSRRCWHRCDVTRCDAGPGRCSCCSPSDTSARRGGCTLQPQAVCLCLVCVVTLARGGLTCWYLQSPPAVTTTRTPATTARGAALAAATVAVCVCSLLPLMMTIPRVTPPSVTSPLPLALSR
jgi:hypothetical protein